MINQIKDKAKKQGLSFSEFMRQRVYCDPIILEELEEIKSLLQEKNGTRK